MNKSNATTSEDAPGGNGDRSFGSGAPRIDELPPHFATELDRDNYFRDLSIRQAKRDAAWAECPPGTKIKVSTARGITSRRRAGVDFGQTAKLVEVVDTTGEKLAARIASGEDVVDPEGAKEILADDGLLSLGGRGSNNAGDTSKIVDDLRAQLANKDSELRALRAELAKRGGIAGESGATTKGDGKTEADGEPKPTANPTRTGAPKGH